MMTTKQVLAALRGFPTDALVVFDFDRYGVSPDQPMSWRGIYAEPAIGYSYGRCTVDQFVEMLGRVTAETFIGYKGGAYCYTGDEPLHVDNWGDVRGIYITGLRADGDRVVIETGIDR